MKVREIIQTVMRRWPAGAVALVIALAFVLAGQGSTTPLAAQVGTTTAVIVTEIHFPNHTPLACFNVFCVGNHVGPANSLVHDLAAVISTDPNLTPTGTVRFLFWGNGKTLNCTGIPSQPQWVVPVVPSVNGVGLAESPDIGPLPAGDYSYRTRYTPDAAAQALGFGATPGPCEQLRLINITSGTVIHHSDHTPLDCFEPTCPPGGGQVAPDGSVIHDLETVDSSDDNRPPTGTVDFAFFNDTPECDTRPASIETVAVVITGGNPSEGTAETADVTLAPGSYSFKAIYNPDAAAIALGLGQAPANCEQLRITPVETPIP
jgi:hypothetical protein